MQDKAEISHIHGAIDGTKKSRIGDIELGVKKYIMKTPD
jgi:hypothetical protein